MKKIITLLCFVLLYHSGFSQWTNLNASMTQVRQHFAAVAVGDSGYAISGGGSGGYVSSACLYSKPNNAWTGIQTYSGGDNNGTLAFAIGDTIYAGTGAAAGYNYGNTFYEFNVATQQWTGKTTSYNYQGRTSAVTFVIGDTGYVGGGLNSGYPTNNYSNNNPVNDFWRYIPATGVWDTIPHCPAKGVGCNAVAFVLNGKAYVGTGGVQDAPGSQTFDPVSDFWCYDPSKNQWDSITPFGGGPRMAAVAFASCGRGYVGTGCTDNGQSVLVNDIWAFDPNGGPIGPNGPMGSWTQVSSFSGPSRMSAGAFIIGTHAYICGGGQPANGNLTFGDIWEYTPTPSFYANSPVCTGQQVQFTDSSLFFPNNWSWSFYGGTASDSTAQNPIVTYNTPGTYSVTLTAWNDCDTGTTTETSYITVSASPQITFTPLAPVVCNGQKVLLTANDGNSSYSWSTTASGTISSTDTLTVNPTTTTTYYLTDNNGSCSGYDSITVAVDAAPALTVTPGAPTLCSGASVKIIADTTGKNYTWSPTTGLSATTGDSVIANPSVNTTYTIGGTDSLGCVVSSTVVVTVDTAPALIVLPQPGPLFCSGLSAELSVSGGGSDFSWSPSNSLSASSGDSVLASPIVSTTYTVSGNDSAGCAATGTEIVTVIASPNKPSFYQHGDTLTSSSATENQWYMNGVPLNGDTSQNLIINNTSPDSFYVVVNNEANGCSTSSDTAITTGLNQLSVISNQLSIYPNPFDNDIVINISTSALSIKGWTLEVVDVLGRRVYNQQSLKYNNTVDLSNLASGVYFVTVINKTGKAVVPVVKQN